MLLLLNPPFSSLRALYSRKTPFANVHAFTATTRLFPAAGAVPTPRERMRGPRPGSRICEGAGPRARSAEFRHVLANPLDIHRNPPGPQTPTNRLQERGRPHSSEYRQIKSGPKFTEIDAKWREITAPEPRPGGSRSGLGARGGFEKNPPRLKRLIRPCAGWVRGRDWGPLGRGGRGFLIGPRKIGK